MAKIDTTPWDVADHLDDDDDVAAYLEAALEDGDHRVITAAIGDVARAKGMSWVARETGLGRESLYKALSAEGNPEFATVLKVVRALGFRLRAAVASDDASKSESRGGFGAASAPMLADDGERYG